MGGVYQQHQTCGVVPCNPVGACCTGTCCTPTYGPANGGCISGVWIAGGSCTPSPCALGACCAPNCTCTCGFQSDCLAPSYWVAGASSCSPTPCPDAAACGAGDEYISYVRLGDDFINSSTADPSTCHRDFTWMSPKVLCPGTAYPLVLTVANDHPEDQVAAWVDWNGNGQFTDLGERFGLIRDPNVSNYFDGTIAVPADATFGTKRMRIRLVRGSANSPCTHADAGETEDYHVDIRDDAGSLACGPNNYRIYSVELGNFFHHATSSGAPAGCYSDLSMFSPSPTVCAGVGYDLEVTSFTPVGRQVGVWFDWNRNGSLHDAGEQLTLFQQHPAVPNLFSTRVEVPATMTAGPIKMRVRLMGDGVLSACGSTDEGEVHDYSVTVVTLGACCLKSGECLGLVTRAQCPDAPDYVFTPCQTTCDPNPCPPPKRLFAVLAGGGGRNIPDPFYDPQGIKASLMRFPSIREEDIHIVVGTDGGAAINNMVSAIAEVRQAIRPGDAFLFCFFGHGGFFQGGTPQPPIPLGALEALFYQRTHNEYENLLCLSGTSVPGYTALGASGLAALLRSVSPDSSQVQKLIVVEACFSGGIWRPGGAGIQDVPNTALIASSDGGHFTVARPDSITNFFAVRGRMLEAFRDSLDAQSTDDGLPSFGLLSVDLASRYVPSAFACTVPQCYAAIPEAATTEQDIFVEDPTFALVTRTTPDFDANAPLTAPVAWCGPGIAVHPMGTAACAGVPTIFRVTAANATFAELIYQWRLDGLPITNEPGYIDGATTATLTIIRAHAIDAGEYDCVVANSCGSVTSVPAPLTVCAPDINCSAVLSVQDIFDFLALYFAHDPRGDFNGVSGWSVQDIFDFLAAYFAGCP